MLGIDLLLQHHFVVGGLAAFAKSHSSMGTVHAISPFAHSETPHFFVNSITLMVNGIFKQIALKMP